jgi:hypothetical protein
MVRVSLMGSFLSLIAERWDGRGGMRVHFAMATPFPTEALGLPTRTGGLARKRKPGLVNRLLLEIGLARSIIAQEV